MIRVDADELDAPPGFTGIATLRGEPFDGTAYVNGEDGRLLMEWTFYRGELWGPHRTWWENGRLAESSYAVAGLAHGVSRSWHRNGRKAKVDVRQFGVRVRCRRWDEDGRVEKDYALGTDPSSEASRRLIETFRQHHGVQAEAEDIPVEFLHATEDDWR